MPGLSFICDFNEDLREKETEILRSLNSLLHFEHYKANILLKEKAYFLCSTTYDEYPMASFEDDYLIYLEGKIYNKNHYSLRKELNTLAKLLSENTANKKDQIAEWLLNVDGDFIIFILNKKAKEIYIINDALGRLPLYYHRANGRLLISRESRFIANLMNKIRFDRMAIAQYLLLKYPLGKRTLIEDLNRLKPATIVRVKLDQLQADIETIFQFNFDEKKYSKTDIRDNVNSLIALFSEACKGRANAFGGYRNILALSGGLDSRTVGACLKRNSISFQGATYMDVHERAKMDAQTAELLASVLDIDWEVFRLEPPKGLDFYTLLRIKNGLNYLGMGYILPFFGKLKEAYGSRLVYFTGDGGQILKPELRVSRKVRKLDDLIDYAICTNQLFSLSAVAELTQIAESEIVSELKSHFLSYPEKELENKYSHFLIYEENLNYCFEGEDRNRFYFWSATPFYSIPFFDYVMNCPTGQISRYKLYREVLSRMSPQVAAIVNAEWRMAITSKKLKLLFIYHKLPSPFKKIIRRAFKNPIISYNGNSTIKNCCLEQMSNCNAIHNYFSQSLKSVIDNCNKYEFETLFTITSSIEEVECSQSAIRKYYYKNLM